LLKSDAMHGIKYLLPLDADRDLHLLPQLLQQVPQLAHGDLGRSHVHGHDHGEGALEDRLGDVQDIDIVLSQ
ncbi:HTH-type transcriptional regulator immR, partial [Dysosmobacter welbionis]